MTDSPYVDDQDPPSRLNAPADNADAPSPWEAEPGKDGQVMLYRGKLVRYIIDEKGRRCDAELGGILTEPASQQWREWLCEMPIWQWVLIALAICSTCAAIFLPK
jgi:hypothetical protein